MSTVEEYLDAKAVGIVCLTVEEQRGTIDNANGLIAEFCLQTYEQMPEAQRAALRGGSGQMTRAHLEAACALAGTTIAAERTKRFQRTLEDTRKQNGGMTGYGE